MSLEQTIAELMELTRQHPVKTASVGALVAVLPLVVAKVIEFRSGTDLSTIVHLLQSEAVKISGPLGGLLIAKGAADVLREPDIPAREQPPPPDDGCDGLEL